jgi:cell division protein YceG involved in septum cleavage
VHYINKQDYHKALMMISDIEPEDKRNAEMTRYASLFLNKCAKDTIEQL